MRLSMLVSIASRAALGQVGNGTRNGGTISQIRKLIPESPAALLSFPNPGHYYNIAMPSASPSELDSLFHQLQRRMVESGEWDRYGRLYSWVLLSG